MTISSMHTGFVPMMSAAIYIKTTLFGNTIIMFRTELEVRSCTNNFKDDRFSEGIEKPLIKCDLSEELHLAKF